MATVQSKNSQLHRTKRATISDVSEALGLTKSTVSRALNGYPDIAANTRNKVQRMANKMGYRPLATAQAIRTGRVRAIGFIIEMAEHDAHRPFMAEFLAGMSRSASAEGWTLTVAASSSPDETLDIISKLRTESKADGFIIPRTLINDDRITTLQRNYIPFVMFGRTDTDEETVWYDIAGEDAMCSAVEHLHGLGHRRIAFINGGSKYKYSQLRRGGYLEGLARVGLQADPTLMAEECLTEEDGRAAASAMLSQDAPPTGFVFALDKAALGLYPLAAELGLTIGKHLSVISYDGVPEGASVTPPLSTHSVDITRAGERLGALLIRHIRGDEAEDLHELEQATFLDRGSAGAPVFTSAQLSAHLRDLGPQGAFSNGRKYHENP